MNRQTFLARLTQLATCPIALMLLTNFASGQLTYVDASVDTNLTPSSAVDIFNETTDNGGDNLWNLREEPATGSTGNNSFGADGSIYETFPAEDAPELTQTISGLTPGNDIDVYVAWWSSTTENWSQRGGLTSKPDGTNPLYDRLGTVGTAGQLGVFANWSVLPPENPNVADDFTGTAASTLEGNRVMLLAKVGTQTVGSGGTLDVYIDDGGLNAGGQRTFFDGVAYAPAGSNVQEVSATVDRTTGDLTLSSNIDLSISSLSVSSPSGAINSAAWSPITGNLDGGGNSSFDSDLWEISSQTDNLLAENEIDRDPSEEVVEVDGGILGPGGVSSMNLGNVWTPSPFEDLVVNLALEDQQFTVPLTVEFTGGTPIMLGDFDQDNDIDVDDYAVVLRGLNRSQAGQTDLQSYALGDVTGNQLTNFNDLARFRQLYDDANGAGAFASLAGVPEPSSLVLFGSLIIGMVACFRKRSGRQVAYASLALLLVCMSNAAEAQITYIDADLSTSPSSNTVIVGGSAVATGNLGGWETRSAGAVVSDGSTDDADFANNSNVFQGPGAPGTTSELATTITGLDPSEFYTLYAFFWDDTPGSGASWDIAAGTTSGDLTHFDNSNAIEINADGLVTGLNVLGQGDDNYDDYIDGNRVLFAAELPREATGVSSVDIFLNPSESAATAGQRTWYDGVGYQISVPKPMLEVNTTTGEVTLLNPTEESLDFSYYEITSADNSLNPAGWNSFDAQNVDAVDGSDAGSVAGDSLLEGWDVAGQSELTGDFDADGEVDSDDLAAWQDDYGDSLAGGDFLDWQRNLGEVAEAGGGTPDILNETNFLGQTTLAAGSGSLSLGNAYDAGVGAEDLIFRYGSVDDPDSLTRGRVRYVTSASAEAVATPEPSSVLLASLALLLVGVKQRPVRG